MFNATTRNGPFHGRSTRVGGCHLHLDRQLLDATRRVHLHATTLRLTCHVSSSENSNHGKNKQKNPFLIFVDHTLPVPANFHQSHSGKPTDAHALPPVARHVNISSPENGSLDNLARQKSSPALSGMKRLACMDRRNPA
jgi:hypothetical protein